MAQSGWFARPWTPWLLGAGVASAALYWRAFVLPFPLLDYYAQGHVDYAWLTQYRVEGTAVFIGAFGALFGLLVLAHAQLRQGPSDDALPMVLLGHLVLSLILVWMYPAAAVDIYDYYLYGRITLVHDGNPFIHPPGLFQNDPYLYLSPWAGEPSVYGPVWQAMSLIPTAIAGQDLLRALILFKLTVILGSLGTTWLIFVVLRRVAPGRAAAGALLFGWNPLVLFETAGNGHNDSVMTAFMMLAVLTLVLGPRAMALPGLAAAALVKVHVALLGPLVLAGLFLAEGARRVVRQSLIGAALGLAFVAASYAPYWVGPATLSFLGRGHWFTASPATLFREALRRWGLSFDDANQVATLVAAVVFGVIYALVAMRLARETPPQPSPQAGRGAVPFPPPAGGPRGVVAADRTIDWSPWFRAAWRVTLAYLFVAALWWHAWYLLMLICFAALLGDPALEARTNLFCFGALLSYVVFKYVWWFWEPTGDYFTIMLVSVLAIFSLPSLHWAMGRLDQLASVASERNLRPTTSTASETGAS